MTERMNLNMEELEAVSGGYLEWFQPYCDHAGYEFFGPCSFKKEEGRMYQWGRCKVCGWEEWLPVSSEAEEVIAEEVFAPATKK